MGREWKPGDVAMVKHETGEYRAIRVPKSAWSLASGWADCLTDDLVTAARPLVTIDPEDAEAVNRLADAFCAARWDHAPGSDECDPLTRSSMATALREFANPTPPKPDEPTGLGAVVVDVEGIRWTRVEAGHAKTPNPWYPADAADFQPDEWHNLCAVEVLSEGVIA